MLDILTPSGDRKTTNKATKGGRASIRNAFGLPAGDSCPGATPFCGKICYAGKMERLPTLASVRKLIWHNYSALVYAEYLGGVNAMVDQLDHMVIAFKKESVRKHAPLVFRVHWDGDFFSADYARAWAIVCRAHKDITFWVYTRSFFALPVLRDIPNLTVYVSADPNNLPTAQVMSKLYHMPIAYVDTVFEDGILDGKTYKCPENRGSLELISSKGSACVRCGVCIKGKGNVLFSVTKK